MTDKDNDLLLKPGKVLLLINISFLYGNDFFAQQKKIGT